MMNKRMLVAGVLSIINLFLLYVSIFVIGLYILPGQFLTFFPLIVGGIVYYWANKKRKYDTLKSFIYFNIAFFLSFIIPFGALVLIYVLTAPIIRPMYGVEPMYGVPMPAPEYGVGAITGTVLFGFKARIYLIMDSIKKLFRKI
ncbi:MAG: hypothetical protein V1672_00985 [Candidatus Diapherotrites archaeon]